METTARADGVFGCVPYASIDLLTTDGWEHVFHIGFSTDDPPDPEDWDDSVLSAVFAGVHHVVEKLGCPIERVRFVLLKIARDPSFDAILFYATQGRIPQSVMINSVPDYLLRAAADGMQVMLHWRQEMELDPYTNLGIVGDEPREADLES